jgi:Flp pilus assembly CpaE family ATPase
VKHSSGVRVLAEPFYAEDAENYSIDIDEILDVLAQSFDFVVVDTAKEFDEMLALVLDKAVSFFRYGNGCAVVKECP